MKWCLFFDTEFSSSFCNIFFDLLSNFILLSLPEKESNQSLYEIIEELMTIPEASPF